jgi:hypothetical protein
MKGVPEPDRAIRDRARGEADPAAATAGAGGAATAPPPARHRGPLAERRVIEEA